jgi:hypothetical protein
LEKDNFTMQQIQHYNTLDDVLGHFLTILPEAKPDRIASISKYARINNKDIKLQAIKRKDASGFTWNLEIAVDIFI